MKYANMIGQHENFETATMAYGRMYHMRQQWNLSILSIMRMRKYYFSPSSVYSSFIPRPKENVDRVD
jgi:hypothetical protein